MGRKRVDLIGRRFGKLVVKQMQAIVGQRSKCVCECECGKIVLVASTSLIQGLSKTCGCSRYFSALVSHEEYRKRYKDIVALRSNGLSCVEIAEKVGKSCQLVYNILKRLDGKC